MENPNSGNSVNVPTSDTGTASSGMSVARQPCRKMKTTMMTSMIASTRVCSISFMPSVTASVVSSDDHVIHVRREALLEFRHERPGVGGGLHGIGIRQLVERDERGGLAVQARQHVVVLRAQFDAGHVLDPHDGPARRRAEDDLAELLRRFQAALRPHRVGEFLPRRHRLAADLAGGIHGVLRLDGVDDFRDGDAHLRQPVGPDPEADGVLARAENRDAGDARHARHLVVDVDVGVVGQEDAVVGVARRIEREHDQRRHRWISGRSRPG